MIKKYGASRDQALMRLAIEQARQCVSEPGRVSPMVGAVVVRPNGSIVGKAYRGERKSGEHAEYTLLEGKLGGEKLTGSILYTTLEPCTDRNAPKLPCAQHILERQIKHVVIGVLDSNPAIRGKGERWLTSHGIEVTRFTPDLMSEIEELQRYFNRLHNGSGPTSSNSATVSVTPVRPSSEGSSKRSSLSVPVPKSNPSAQASDWDSTATFPAQTSFEKALHLNSDSPVEHAHRTEIADELRGLRDYLSDRDQLEGEVLAAFVANERGCELHQEGIYSAMGGVYTWDQLRGPMMNLVNADVLTFDEDYGTVGIGSANTLAIQKLCEFFAPRDSQSAKTVLRNGKWDTIIPQGK